MLDADHRGDIDDGSIDSHERISNEAVCAGGALSRPADDERPHSALELLAQITTHTPYLALDVVELAGASDAAAQCLAREARRQSTCSSSSRTSSGDEASPCASPATSARSATSSKPPAELHCSHVSTQPLTTGSGRSPHHPARGGDNPEET